MNKTELVNRIAETVDLSKAAATRALDAMFEAIAESLAQGETVAIPGFGNFSVGSRAARTGRNPQTGETIEIAAAMVVKFKAAKALKEAVNEEISA